MKNKKGFLKRIIGALMRHKWATSIIVLTCLIGSYGIYSSAKTANIIPTYTLSPARLGTITQTVTGSGQISASNQTDILGQVSGTIKFINVEVGQRVKTGDLIATIDNTDAALSLESSRIAYAKLIQPADEADIVNASNTLNKAYNDGFHAAATIYLDLPAIMSGLKDMLYSQTGFLSDQTSTNLTITGRDYRNLAGQAYDRAIVLYANSLNKFKVLNRGSATSSLDQMLDETYITIKAVSEAVSKAQNAITFIQTSQPEYYTNNIGTAATSVNSWASQANSDLGTLVSSQNSIASSNNSLQTLLTGSDELDIRSAKLSLTQAERNYADYFIRAPYDGVIGKIPVSVYGQASSGTTIATIIGEQKIASISLNEVDAAKVATGQEVTITFDAIDGLNASGTVSVVDQIGSVSSGVVSYGIKILINTDDNRIKPGMSVNVTIVTKKIENVLVVPFAAIKKQGSISYVQVLDRSLLSTGTTNNATNNFSNRPSTFTGTGQSLTISTAVMPTQVTVTTGQSDDTNTEITSGLEAGQLVVTKTLTTSSGTTAAPSILNSIGGSRPATSGAGGAVRTGGGAAVIRAPGL